MREGTRLLNCIAALSALAVVAGTPSCAIHAHHGHAQEEDDEEDDDEEDEDEDEDADDGGEEGEDTAESGEVVIELAHAPQAVRDAAARIVGTGVISKVIKEVDEGVTVFEIEFTVDGGERSVDLSESGAVIEIERVLQANGLPDAVAKALMKRYPGSKVAKAEGVETHYFEIEIVVNGKSIKVYATPTGELSDDDDD